MKGLFLRRSYPSAVKTVTITVTGRGDSEGCYLMIGGNKVVSAGVYKLARGETIICRVAGGGSANPGRIYVGNIVVASAGYNVSSVEYEYTVTGNVEVNLSYKQVSTKIVGTITITEE